MITGGGASLRAGEGRQEEDPPPHLLPDSASSHPCAGYHDSQSQATVLQSVIQGFLFQRQMLEWNNSVLKKSVQRPVYLCVHM